MIVSVLYEYPMKHISVNSGKTFAHWTKSFFFKLIKSNREGKFYLKKMIKSIIFPMFKNVFTKNNIFSFTRDNW